ncbi:hypothetical protein Rhopal_003048-T1 [Rhodotorula paludigena]|uniref:Replication termination factor 2 n=1 Tax=Rhodotorula paludigena TaxID=86838 RepID=A0AAV5GBY1_9BASI|nr:hypothetical protein Rhopal_003048-T1 [Rhodotorula paludigena]
MGNDGGSIPKRGELVRTKQKRTREDDADRVRQLWAFCALSKVCLPLPLRSLCLAAKLTTTLYVRPHSQQPLREPIVSCPLGRLYNKEALIAHLLNPPTAADPHSPFGSDGQLVAGHIRSLKDVVTLRLTPNPALSPSASASSSSAEPAPAAAHGAGMGADRAPPAQFVCPISLREMNGATKFVYRRPCGCVVSDAALREMRRGADKKGLAGDGDAGGELSDERVCPVDGAASAEPEEWVVLNPKGEEAERVRERWEAKKVREKEEKKALKAAKRKAAGAEGGDGDEAGRAAGGKKARKDDAKAAAAHAQAKAAAPAVKAGASVPQLSATLAAKLAEQKKQQSPAIASLYAKKTDNEMKDSDGRSNWMTIGSYSRF